MDLFELSDKSYYQCYISTCKKLTADLVPLVQTLGTVHLAITLPVQRDTLAWEQKLLFKQSMILISHQIVWFHIPPTWSASEFLLATGHEHVCKERNVRITCFRVRTQSSVCHCHPRISVCLFLPCTWHIRRLIDNINIDLDSGSSHQVHTFSVLQVMFETLRPIMLTDMKESQVQLLTTQFVWHDRGMRVLMQCQWRS